MEDARAVVCVDVSGGDEPPQVVLEGITQALEADPDLEVLAVGPSDIVVPFCEGRERCEPLLASQVIGMDEHPLRAVKTKRESSIVVASKALRSGQASGFFSAGSTGAIMAAATLLVGRIKGIDRPALTLPLPGKTPTVFLDVGANADVKTINLVQYAHMGVAYAQVALGIAAPRVGMLNIGSEETKGSMAAQERFAALQKAVPQFVGNAEGTDILSDTFDVIVTDGFTGNVALKTLEGTAKFLMSQIKDISRSSLAHMVGSAFLSDGLHKLGRRMSGEEFGGAVLLGVDGVVVIGHGATSPTAVCQGTLVAARSVRQGLVAKIAALCSPDPADAAGQKLD